MDDFSWLVDHLPKEIPDKFSRIPGFAEVKDRLHHAPETLVEARYCELPPDNDLYYKEGTIPALPEMISDVHGRLEKIFMTYPYTGKDFFKYQDFFKSFIAALPKYTEVYLLGNFTKKERNLAKNEDKNNRLIKIKRVMQKELDKLLDSLKSILPDRFILIEPQNLHGYSIWAQDPFIPVWDRGRADKTIHFIEPIQFKESKNGDGEGLINADSKIADHIAALECFEELSTSHSRVCLFFHGGNVLSGDDFILVGQDDVLKTREFFRKYFPEQGLHLEKHSQLIEAKKNGVEKAFKYIFGQDKEVISVGCKNKTKVNAPKGFRHKLYGPGHFQPFFHIDLFVTPVGYLFEEDLYTIVLAEPFNAAPYDAPDVDKYIIRPLQEWLWEIKMDLEKKEVKGKRKFIVRTMPLPMFPVKTRNSTSWIPISYNNCLLEVLKDNEKKVWVPQYSDHPKARHLKPYDELALDQWRVYGFKPIPVSGCFPFILRGGSLRCITKCLHRSDD